MAEKLKNGIGILVGQAVHYVVEIPKPLPCRSLTYIPNFLCCDRFVRQALLFAVSMVILSVPPHLLVTDLQDDLLECKLWIEGKFS